MPFRPWQDRAHHTQRFFMGHKDDITAVALHPNRVTVASGEVGKRPVVCVWHACDPQTPVFERFPQNKNTFLL